MTTASVAFLHPMRGKTIAMLTRLTFIAAVWPSAAGAQAGAPLRGTVVDRATAAVVANAAISIRLTNDSVVVALHTDSLGRFRFDATPRGVFILQMQKIGFEPTRAAFSTDADTGAVLILMSKINTARRGDCHRDCHATSPRERGVLRAAQDGVWALPRFGHGGASGTAQRGEPTPAVLQRLYEDFRGWRSSPAVARCRSGDDHRRRDLRVGRRGSAGVSQSGRRRLRALWEHRHLA